MKLYIPEIGDELLLTKDWQFSLFNESRNEDLFTHFNLPYNSRYNAIMKPVNATIPKGEILKVDRIYIRKGASDFSSILFRWNKLRFWAKLIDVNNIEFQINQLASTRTVVEIVYPESYYTDTNTFFLFGKMTDLEYYISGKKHVEANKFTEKFHHQDTYPVSSMFGLKQSTRQVNYYNTMMGSKVATKKNIQTYICNKHGLNPKDCYFRVKY